MTDEPLTPTRQIFEDFVVLPAYRRRQALAIACRDALAVWQGFVERRGEIGGHGALNEWPPRYMDGVVGGFHDVDLELPARALAEIERQLRGEPVDAEATAKAYYEPTVAMQGDDLAFPEEITYAYYAIYNLHLLVFERPGAPDPDHVVLRQVASALAPAVGLDEWMHDWRTRVWDAWASTPAIPDTVTLAPAVAAALLAGDLPRALAHLDDEGASCLRAVLLGLVGRRAEAIEVAARALGSAPPDPTLRAWIDQHLYALAPDDVIAVSPIGKHYAVIAGHAFKVHAIGLGHTPGGEQPGRLRRVRISLDGMVVSVVGDLVDPLGAWGSRITGADLDERSSPGYQVDLPGRRELAAFGPYGTLVAVDARRTAVIRPGQLDVLGDARVVGAAVDEDGFHVATHDGRHVSIWQRDGADPFADRAEILVARFDAAPPGVSIERLVLAGDDRVLVVRTGAPALLHDFFEDDEA